MPVRDDLSKRLPSGTVTLLFADLDLSRCLHEKAVHDYAGHYNRPDIFTVQVDRRRRSLFRPREGAAAAPGNEQPRHEVGPAEQDGETAGQVVYAG